jgi:two-component system chemotaxis response regulator CheB
MKKRVLIVDDSPSARLALRRVLEGAGFEIAGEATCVTQALTSARTLSPDLVTMDMQLGDEDGLEAARAIMLEVPTPIVIVTGLERSGLAFRATEVGALDVLSKPPLGADERSARARQRFVAALSALSEVKLIGTRRRSSSPAASIDTIPRRSPSLPPLCLLGASTGGPTVLRTVLQALPNPFPGAIVIVQHIEVGFGPSFAAWLEGAAGHPTRLVTSPELLREGTVYVAPDHAHLCYSVGDVVRPIPGEPRRFQRPSIDVFFESIPVWRAPSTVAAILTGMGDDGAAGLLRLRRHGALTLVQSPESCVVGAMPEAALALGAASRQVSLERLGREITRLMAELPLGSELPT